MLSSPWFSRTLYAGMLAAVGLLAWAFFMEPAESPSVTGIEPHENSRSSGSGKFSRNSQTGSLLESSPFQAVEPEVLLSKRLPSSLDEEELLAKAKGLSQAPEGVFSRSTRLKALRVRADLPSDTPTAFATLLSSEKPQDLRMSSDEWEAAIEYYAVQGLSSSEEELAKEYLCRVPAQGDRAAFYARCDRILVALLPPTRLHDPRIAEYQELWKAILDENVRDYLIQHLGGVVGNIGMTRGVEDLLFRMVAEEKGPGAVSGLSALYRAWKVGQLLHPLEDLQALFFLVLEDKAVPQKSKAGLLSIASQARWTEVLPIARKLAQTPTTRTSLRAAAVHSLGQLGSAEDLQLLEMISKSPGSGFLSKALQSASLSVGSRM